MPLFLTLSEGPRADQARPVLATGDQRLVGEVLRAIGRLGESCAGGDEDERPTVPQQPAVPQRRRELAVTR